MRLGRFRILALPVLFSLLTACSTKPTFYLEIQLLGTDVPCQGVRIDFSSYDYNAVLDSLVRLNNPGPRPDSTELMALLGTYQQILEQSAILADSVDQLRDELEKMKNTSIEYRKNYPVFQALEKQVGKMLEERHNIHEQYLETKASYQSRLDSWSKVAYKGFDDFKVSIPPDLQTKSETTDRNCMVKKLVLPYGKWWLYCEVRRPGTTNEKLNWNFGMPEGSDSIMIILDESNASVVRELL